MTKNFKAWPKHWPQTQKYPEIPVYSFLESTALRVPNRIAIIFGGMELTYGELKELCDRFASALAGMGIQKGDRIAINLPNCPQFAIAYYAALRLGAIFTPLSPLLSPKEVLHQLNDSGAKAIITLDLIYPGIASIIPETCVRHVIITSIADCYNSLIAPLKPIEKIEVPEVLDMAKLIKKHTPYDQEISINVKKDLAHIAYTGGTTGVSKGVMLTHANVTANVLQFANWPNGSRTEMVGGIPTPIYPSEIAPEDRTTSMDQETTLVVVPWFHAMGTVGYLNLMIYAGTTMVVFPRFDPVEYIEAVSKYKATLLGGAPQLYLPLINLPNFNDYDLSGIKIATSGAAPLPVVVIDKLQEAFLGGYVTEGYGLTECTMGATTNPPGRDGLKPGSVGIPVYDTELKIINPATGVTLPQGSEGEICIKGPQVMEGYWNKPEATAKVLENGWLKTGDIGKEDENGYFFITERLKDMIIYKGYNVYPRELEEVLFKHETIEQCAVVGKPDEKTGEEPVAFIKLNKGVRVTTSEIKDYVNSQVAAYKKIRDIIFVDDIPVSGAGKVLKRELRKQFE